MNNIYINTLKLGFENPEGISFDKVVELLEIDLTDTTFKLNFTIWFYSNFYNLGMEGYVIGSRTSANASFAITSKTLEPLEKFNTDKSYIKGDAINQYIDYLELERTRESATQASYFAASSIFIALLAILIPFFVSPESITIIGKVAIISVLLTIISSIYVGIDIAKAKPKKDGNFWTFIIVLSVLGAAVVFSLLSLLNKIFVSPELWLKGLVILPVIVFVVGMVVRKIKTEYD